MSPREQADAVLILSKWMTAFQALKGFIPMVRRLAPKTADDLEKLAKETSWYLSNNDESDPAA